MEISKGDFIGTISKTFGKNGEVLVKLNQDYFEVLKEEESVLIEIDKKPIPFFISNIHFRNNKSAVLNFHNYGNTNIMEEYVGCKVYLEIESPDKTDNPIFPFNIKEFTILNSSFKKIGILKDIIQYPNNTVIQIVNGNNKFLIPFTEELIIKTNKRKKTLIIEIPDGLIELNK